MVSTMLTLFRHWLEAGGKRRAFSESPQTPPKVLAYAVINNVGVHLGLGCSTNALERSSSG